MTPTQVRAATPPRPVSPIIFPVAPAGADVSLPGDDYNLPQ